MVLFQWLLSAFECGVFDVVSCRVVSVLCDPHILQLNCMLE